MTGIFIHSMGGYIIGWQVFRCSGRCFLNGVRCLAGVLWVNLITDGIFLVFCKLAYTTIGQTLHRQIA